MIDELPPLGTTEPPAAPQAAKQEPNLVRMGMVSIVKESFMGILGAIVRLKQHRGQFTDEFKKEAEEFEASINKFLAWVKTHLS